MRALVRCFRACAALLALALGSACAVDAEREPACGASPLLGGTVDVDTQAVCRLSIAGGDTTCTATLIAPAVVLTAKHCVQHPNGAAPLAPADLSVAFGADAAQPDARRSVTRVIAVPGGYTVDAQGQVQGELLGKDLALLELSAALADVAPLALDLSGAAIDGPGPFLILGFGTDERGEDGIRRHKQVSIARVADTLLIGPHACNGDSGGPLLSPAGQVIAVASASVGECGTGDVMYTRLDTNADFIEPALAQLSVRGSVTACAR